MARRLLRGRFTMTLTAAPDPSLSPIAALGGETRGERLANWLTHGIGAVLSAAGLPLLVVFASIYGDVWHIVSYAIFGSTLIALYTASTLYHLSRQERWRWVLRRWDHAAIFLLIAGTYTPFLLVSLRGPWGWSLFGVIWLLCGMGAALKFCGAERFKTLSLVAYLAAGWMVVVAIRPLIHVVPTPGLWLLVAGGLSYTCGVAFYVWRGLRYHHACWHLFVLGGSTCHFLAVLLFLTPWGS
jgi:hemolysin III